MSFEKELIQTLEPLVDKVLDLEKKINSVEVIRGKDGLGIEADQWSDGVYREGAFVTHNLGQVFKSLKDTATEPGTSPDWQRIGSMGFRHCGAFDETREYVEGDTYIKNYGWFAVLNGKSVCIAGRGAKGDRGDQGERGLPGIKGLDGADVIAFEARGLSIALVTKAPDGSPSTFVADMAPVIKAQIEAIRSDLRSYVDSYVEKKSISLAKVKQIVAESKDWAAFQSAIALLKD